MKRGRHKDYKIVRLMGNWLNRSHEAGDIYTSRMVARLLSFAATEVEAWYQSLTQ